MQENPAHKDGAYQDPEQVRFCHWRRIKNQRISEFLMKHSEVSEVGKKEHPWVQISHYEQISPLTCSRCEANSVIKNRSHYQDSTMTPGTQEVGTETPSHEYHPQVIKLATICTRRRCSFQEGINHTFLLTFLSYVYLRHLHSLLNKIQFQFLLLHSLI